MIRHVIPTELPLPVTQMMLCLLLIQVGTSPAQSNPPLKPAPAAVHDTNHPLMLSDNDDFLAPLLALHREALSVSKIAAQKVAQPQIRNYAVRAIKHHSGQITTLEKMVRKYARDKKPDFHITPMPEEMQRLPGSTIGERYLRIMIRLLSEKIELAEFASGTAKINHAKRMAARTIDTGYSELMMLSRMLEQMSP